MYMGSGASVDQLALLLLQLVGYLGWLPEVAALC
jgi:hypothetical protein